MFNRTRSRLLLAVLLACALAGAFGMWVLLHPASIWVQPWRAERSGVSGNVIFGPYPVEADFRALKQKGVTTIISLLDSSIPYEKVLLADERELARQFGMEVLNFPMASILGQSFGKDYMRNSRAAAQAAINSQGVAYIHCYLGLHRSVYVQEYLDAFGASTSYAGRNASGRSPDVLALDRANLAFIALRYEDTLAELAKVKRKTAESTLLEAWSNYRLNRIDPARAGFERVLALDPQHPDALTGLGYCALRQNDLDVAQGYFGAVLSRRADDPAAIEGLGYVRYRQGNLPDAKALFERSLAANPENPEARAMLEKLEQPLPASGAR